MPYCRLPGSLSVSEKKRDIAMKEKQLKNICWRVNVLKRLLFFHLIFLFSLFVLFLSSSEAVPTHLNKAKVKTECSGCHKGHGKKGTTNLAGSKDDLCFKCHGVGTPPPDSGVGQPSDYVKASDIYSELTKISNHKILETARFHVPGEELPEKDPSAPRHASCYDCHNVHKSEKSSMLKGLRGYSGRGFSSTQASRQYELCYNCHSDSANQRSEALNISLAFDSSNPSFHPVETYGKRVVVPSIKDGMSKSRMIDCTDCHGNDNPTGPKGPHGSLYAPILKNQYIRTGGSESPRSYELCYSCHERTSILGDESFKAHKIHVVFNRISCAQCHDAHGSRFFTSLIKFDITTAFPNSNGQLTFQPASGGRPKCFLSCHVNGQIYEHKLDKNLIYTINSRLLNQW